jgi:hypothetical protein
MSRLKLDTGEVSDAINTAIPEIIIPRGFLNFKAPTIPATFPAKKELYMSSAPLVFL